MNKVGMGSKDKTVETRTCCASEGFRGGRHVGSNAASLDRSTPSYQQGGDLGRNIIVL